MAINHADELQIQIDDVYACLGQCGGCILTPTERTAAVPDMSESTLQLTIERLREHAAACAPLRRVNVTFGIADHLLMTDEYLIRLHDLGASIVRAGRPTDQAHSGVFFTTSLIGKADVVLERLARLKTAVADDVPLLPLVVLDPRLMKANKFGPLWRSMVIGAKELFGEIDLSVNLSDEAASQMTPAELLGFADANAFNEVTINWVPTLLNAPRTMGDIAHMRSWLLEFDDLAKPRTHMGTSYRPVIERTVDGLMCQTDGTIPSLLDAVSGMLPETVRKSIEIDHRGHLLPKLEAIGDIAHADRFGLSAFGHLSEGTIEELITKALRPMQREIIAIHSRGDCAACPVSPICAATGFHVATNVGRMTGAALDNGDCPHVAKVLIERIFAERKAVDAARARAA